MRASHNHRPNGLRLRNENGFLTCAQCGQRCDEPEPKTVERSPLPVVPPPFVPVHSAQEGR